MRPASPARRLREVCPRAAVSGRGDSRDIPLEGRLRGGSSRASLRTLLPHDAHGGSNPPRVATQAGRAFTSSDLQMNDHELPAFGPHVAP
jgi:hypothetical protein